ncbi:MAG: C4-dicarboxylic acid transporter DauA [Planctomycetes bacterium]|nr:C4-dicarboxylic acid transporter DauA [Planctomycetota bacterium]MCW8136097.1 C4-dicarboxylic acid transporter DauA [Planctomycetota bacterium]
MSPQKQVSGRHKPAAAQSAKPFPFSVGLRGALREGYGLRNLRADITAGVIVGIVALPLSMALAIASGVPPQHGLYTAIVAGALIAATGGSRLNVSGPTAAFVILLAPISAKYGIGGLALASLMAGGFLVVMGLARLGRLIQFVPHPVTTGFTAGIAVVIATLQLKDFFGLPVVSSGDHYWERVSDIAQAFSGLSYADTVIGALTLVVLVLWPKITRKVPGPLVAITLAAVAAWLMAEYMEAPVATIASRFSYIKDGVSHAGIPQLPPMPLLPWALPGPDGQPLGISWELIRELIGPAMAIAALGAIESLLSAVVADGMAGTRHDPDAELVGQGLGNLVGPFFGGFAATGAIARTATSVRSGGRSPVAGITHALFLLAAVIALAPVLGYLPMAGMAALLLVVAWNMSDARHFMHMLKVAPRSDLAVLLACFGLTVIFDMVIAVGVGVVLAALLFMRRMAEISGARVVGNGDGAQREPLPPGVVQYEIAGPLFFGAADKAIGAIATAGSTKALILDMHAVPAMDATGLVALESLLAKLKTSGTKVLIVGLQSQPRGVLAKAGITGEAPGVSMFSSLAAATDAARRV